MFGYFATGNGGDFGKFGQKYCENSSELIYFLHRHSEYTTVSPCCVLISTFLRSDCICQPFSTKNPPEYCFGKLSDLGRNFGPKIRFPQKLHIFSKCWQNLEVKCDSFVLPTFQCLQPNLIRSWNRVKFTAIFTQSNFNLYKLQVSVGSNAAFVEW